MWLLPRMWLCKEHGAISLVDKLSPFLSSATVPITAVSCHQVAGHLEPGGATPGHHWVMTTFPPLTIRSRLTSLEWCSYVAPRKSSPSSMLVKAVLQLLPISTSGNHHYSMSAKKLPSLSTADTSTHCTAQSQLHVAEGSQHTSTPHA